MPASFQGAEGLVHGGVVPVEESDLGEEGGVFQGLGHLFSFEEGAVHPQHKGALGVLGEPGQSAGQFPAMPLVEEFQVEGARGFVPAEGEVGDDEEPPLFLEGGELLQELPGGGQACQGFPEEAHLVGEAGGEVVVGAFQGAALVQFQAGLPAPPEDFCGEAPLGHGAEGGEELGQLQAVAPALFQDGPWPVHLHGQGEGGAVCGSQARQEAEEAEILAEPAQLGGVLGPDGDFQGGASQEEGLDDAGVVSVHQALGRGGVKGAQDLVFGQVSVELSVGGQGVLGVEELEAPAPLLQGGEGGVPLEPLGGGLQQGHPHGGEVGVCGQGVLAAFLQQPPEGAEEPAVRHLLLDGLQQFLQFPGGESVPAGVLV